MRLFKPKSTASLPIPNYLKLKQSENHFLNEHIVNQQSCSQKIITSIRAQSQSYKTAVTIGDQEPTTAPESVQSLTLVSVRICLVQSDAPLMYSLFWRSPSLSARIFFRICHET